MTRPWFYTTTFHGLSALRTLRLLGTQLPTTPLSHEASIEIPGVKEVGPVFSTVGWKSLERYFGKSGVLECYNVIILCEDAEVTG